MTSIRTACDTRGVKLTPILFGILVVLASAILIGCANGGDTVTEVPDAMPTADPTVIDEDIPVEALPDPLPAPYLFRDDVVFEEAPITETIYVVQPGDTLAAIAERFCITLEEIQRLNTIVDVTQISIGEELRIPIREGGCGAAAPRSAQDEQPAEPQRPPGEIYIVQEGDTLADIAAAHGFTWVDLMNYNGLTEAQATALQIGQALIIPPQPEQAESQAEQAEADQPSEPPG